MANPANFGREKEGVAAYANRVEALRATGTCRTLLILNTCFLVLAGSTPTRGEWSLYTATRLSIRGHFSPAIEPSFVSNGFRTVLPPLYPLYPSKLRKDISRLQNLIFLLLSKYPNNLHFVIIALVNII